MIKEHLYELTEQYQILQDMAYDPEVDEQTLRDTMEGLWGAIEEKADGYAKIITGMKADIEALKEEEERLYARRKRLEDRQKWLKDNLEANMREIGKTKFKTALFSFNIQKNGGLQPLIIDGVIDDIPGRFLIPQDPVPNNEAIRNLLAEKQVDWAHLEPRGESLRIR
ncbi:siphovirus Gp157 family protein [Enterocloster citroniae]|uniref:siphovirus Gp157 family protein n=1 Tax=Enterocloster citroniae TaxID=358743 RepID=UPI0022E58F74|nr:siphovirus Gp157 family protein [Enterocloster citroniae]